MLGELLSAGASLAGGFLQRENNRDAMNMQKDLTQQNVALQREFAQNGIRWKVEDAKAAGIHPIYALGGSGASFSPVSANFSADTSLPNALASAGQDLGRAINSTRTEKERVDAFTLTGQKLALEKAGLENDLLRTQIASATGRLRQTPTPPAPVAGPGYMVPGQTSSGPLIERKPLEVAPAHPGRPNAEGGAITDVGYARTNTGWVPVPSNDVKNRIEDNFVQERLWDMRNNVLPSFGFNTSPPPFKPPPGQKWYFDVARQEYQLKPADTPWYKRGFDVRID